MVNIPPDCTSTDVRPPSAVTILCTRGNPRPQWLPAQAGITRLTDSQSPGGRYGRVDSIAAGSQNLYGGFTGSGESSGNHSADARSTLTSKSHYS